MKSAAVSAAAVALVLGAVSPAWGQEAAPAPPSGPIEIIRTGDVSLTCAAMADEAAQLSATMGGEPGGSLFGRLGGVARAGASMVIPGAALVMAGTDVLTAPERERKEAEAAAVQHRWYYLNGLYAGRNCRDAPAATAAPAAPPPVPGS